MSRSRKKDFTSKVIRVIIWGRNEYDGNVQCSARSFNSFDESPDFYFEHGRIHYILRNPSSSWRAFKKMKHHYVFDCNGVCLSHTPKRYLTKKWNSPKGKLYAEIKVL